MHKERCSRGRGGNTGGKTLLTLPQSHKHIQWRCLLKSKSLQVSSSLSLSLSFSLSFPLCSIHTQHSQGQTPISRRSPECAVCSVHSFIHPLDTHYWPHTAGHYYHSASRPLRSEGEKNNLHTHKGKTHQKVTHLHPVSFLSCSFCLLKCWPHLSFLGHTHILILIAIAIAIAIRIFIFTRKSQLCFHFSYKCTSLYFSL